MKRIIVILFFVFAISSINAQDDSTFFKHELKLSCSDGLLISMIGDGFFDIDGFFYVNISATYLYRPVKWFWVGGIFVNYIGNRIDYYWREYDVNGNYKDYSKYKLKYCAAIAPEIRFSYFHRKNTILYSGFSAGVAFVDGYDSKQHHYPKIMPYFHHTYFGFSCNVGKNKNIFLGGELGAGFKGFLNLHGGYRF